MESQIKIKTGSTPDAGGFRFTIYNLRKSENPMMLDCVAKSKQPEKA